MKSTIKIDYESGRKNAAVIKIAVLEKHEGETSEFKGNQEEDVRDKLIRDFLHTPYQVDKNTFFELKTHYPINGGHVTTIGPVLNESLFYRFRGQILNTFIPYDHLASLNRGELLHKDLKISPEIEERFKKINEFFDWISTLEWV